MYFEMAPYILLGLIFVAILNLVISKDFIIKHTGKSDFLSIFKASLFGVPLPLCSCGVIPTAVYMHQNKSSKPAVVSFLISTPQTGIDSIIATYGMLGWVFAIYRPFAAFIMGLIGGLVVKFSEPIALKPKPAFIPLNQYNPQSSQTFPQRLITTLNYAFRDFLDDIALQFSVGVIISGLISYFVPDGFFSEYGVGDGIIGMLILIAIGIPMYICATASIPIAVSLMMKGFSPGAAFVFLAVGPATNAASLAILSKSLGKKTTAIFVASIALSSILFGYLLNFIFDYFKLNPHGMMSHSGHNHGSEPLSIISLVSIFIFTLLIFGSYYRLYVKKYVDKWKSKSKEENIDTNNIFSISGMTCNHCVDTVSKAIAKVDGVESVEVSLQNNNAVVLGKFNRNDIINAINNAGYETT